MYVLDRVEGQIAIVEKSIDDEVTFLEIDLEVLPSDAREGDVLTFNENAWMVDKEETAQRRNQIENKLRRLGLLQ